MVTHSHEANNAGSLDDVLSDFSSASKEHNMLFFYEGIVLGLCTSEVTYGLGATRILEQLTTS